MFGSQHYPEGQIKPQYLNGIALVRCCTGALQVLEEFDLVSWLTNHPKKRYIITFANGSAAGINSKHRLWSVLAEIAKKHIVKVFPLNWSGEYVAWDGSAKSLHNFDGISIQLKQ